MTGYVFSKILKKYDIDHFENIDHPLFKYTRNKVKLLLVTLLKCIISICIRVKIRFFALS